MKRLMTLIAAITILMNMAACTPDTNATADKAGNMGTKPGIDTQGPTSDTSASPSLNIYYLTFADYVHNAISEFKSKYKDVIVKEKNYQLTSDAEFSKSLSLELLTGRGPDVVICNPLRDLDSINKVFSAEAFADLNEFISKDDNFELADYNSQVINAGVFNGRREFVPLYFSRQLIYTTESILEKNNIDINDNCTLEELTDIVGSLLKNKEGKSKYLFNSEMDFYLLMNFYGNNLLNYEDKKSNFYSSEFKELLKLYKSMKELIAPVEVEEKYNYSLSSLLKNNIIALYIDNYSTATSLYMRNCFISRAMCEDTKIITASEDVNKVRPVLVDIAAINNNCRNKEYAYEFIKILLSEKIQRSSYSKDSLNTFYNPVNIEAFRNDITKMAGQEQNRGCLVEYSSSGNLKTVQGMPLSELLARRLTDVNHNMAEPFIIDKSVKEVIDEALKGYLSGKNNEDQTAKVINDKVELFLNE